MKNLFTKFSLIAALCAIAVSSVSCDDDNKKNTPPPFSSELIGSYKPASVSRPTAADPEEMQEYYLTFDVTWTDPDNIPGIDLNYTSIGNQLNGTEIFGFPYQMPMNTVLSMVEAIGSGIVKGGLIGVELKNDGSFGAQYKDLIVEGTDVSAILGALLNPKFGEEVKSFPNAETSEILPEGAIGYYTKDSKLYFKIGRDFLKAAGGADLDVPALIDGLLTQYPSLGIVSADDYYAIPLKYVQENGVVKVYVDRAMMVPFLDVFSSLLGSLDSSVTMGIDAGKIIKDLKDNTTEMEIALRLQKI
ncbi:hypothetical protein [uncultured Alistipes sp.]|uniref:hypothetical protein n=1 Tax=uncultured Alistipes sp. TaxID=538949 RepID=UPI0025856CCE|nr:hypothetical protein [uncultured Alistipes sp.]